MTGTRLRKAEIEELRIIAKILGLPLKTVREKYLDLSSRSGLKGYDEKEKTGMLMTAVELHLEIELKGVSA